MALATHSVFPVRSPGTVLLMLVGGVLATIAFDLYGQWLAPSLAPTWRLAPEPLAAQSLQVVFGPFEGAQTAGTVLHWLTGIVFYPIGYAFIALPIARAVISGISWVVVAVLYGVVLWVFALYVMAHLVSGNPPFLGFIDITWSALVGHVLYALVVGGVLATRS